MTSLRVSATKVFLGLLSGMLLTACTSVPTAPNYFTLVPQQTTTLVEDKISTSIGLWPIELPDLLDRSGIVSYQDQHRVNISSQNIWAGDLAENIARVIGQDLSQQLGLTQLWYYPWESRQSPDYELRLRIDSLVGPLSGPVNLEARITLRSSKTAEVLLNQQISIQQKVVGDGHDAYVAAVNQIIYHLGLELSQRIKASAAF